MVGSRRMTRPFLLTKGGREARPAPVPPARSRGRPGQRPPLGRAVLLRAAPRYGSSMTTTAAEPQGRETLFTKDTRKLVWITLLCLFLQVLGQNWSAGPLLPGSTADVSLGSVEFQARPWIGWVVLTIGFAVAGFVVGVARRGAARWDQDRVLALGLAGVVGVTVLVWVLFIVQYEWVYWAVAHGDLHPFTIGDVSSSVERAGYAP